MQLNVKIPVTTICDPTQPLIPTFLIKLSPAGVSLVLKAVSFNPGKLTFCRYELFTLWLWSGRCAAAMTHTGHELHPILYKYSFIYFHLLNLFFPMSLWGLEPIQENAKRESVQKRCFKMVLTARHKGTSIVFMKFKNEKSVYARTQTRFDATGWCNLFSLGNQVQLPTGCEN